LFVVLVSHARSITPVMLLFIVTLHPLMQPSRTRCFVLENAARYGHIAVGTKIVMNPLLDLIP
jgi:hypothetical protein